MELSKQKQTETMKFNAITQNLFMVDLILF